MKARNKILIVDDDPKLVEGLGLYLSSNDYEVIDAGDGAEGLRKFHQERPDLVLLDIMMPKIDGWELCQRIRDMSSVPIIMLTARGQEMDRVMGLKLGADDYIAKPFNLKEIEARIEAVLRRTYHQAPPERNGVTYADDSLVIDAESQEVTVDGEPLSLTPTERRLLIYMARNAGQILSTQQILDAVWGPQYNDATESVKFYIWRLRQKIEPDPKNPRYILTEWGIGYRFARGSRPQKPKKPRVFTNK